MAREYYESGWPGWKKDPRNKSVQEFKNFGRKLSGTRDESEPRRYYINSAKKNK